MGGVVPDEQLFERFARANTASLLRTAFLLTGDQHDAEDLLQDTLIYLYPRRQKVTVSDSHLAYVRRCVVNRFLSDRRLASRRDVVLADPPERHSSFDLARDVAEQEDLLVLLRRLPGRQRAAIVLRYRGLTALRADPSAAPAGTEGRP
jgi:RNA polymerase sigma factor (sigma-70 family)